MLQFILGRTGTGKTRTVYAQIREAIQNGAENIIMLIPDQVSLETEKAVLELLGAPDKQTAEAVVSGNLQHFADIACDEVLQNGCDYPVTAEITNMYFNTRRYDGYTLPAGRYDALRVRIGKAEGHNWWCVLYPGICLSAAEERDRQARESFDSGEYEVIHNEPYSYRFKAVEWLEYLHDLFRRGIND